MKILREVMAATGDVLINPSALAVRLRQDPIDPLDELELQVKLHRGDRIVLQNVVRNATQNFESAVIFSTLEISVNLVLRTLLESIQYPFVVNGENPPQRDTLLTQFNVPFTGDVPNRLKTRD